MVGPVQEPRRPQRQLAATGQQHTGQQIAGPRRVGHEKNPDQEPEPEPGDRPVTARDLRDPQGPPDACAYDVLVRICEGLGVPREAMGALAKGGASGAAGPVSEGGIR